MSLQSVEVKVEIVDDGEEWENVECVPELPLEPLQAPDSASPRAGPSAFTMNQEWPVRPEASSEALNSPKDSIQLEVEIDPVAVKKEMESDEECEGQSEKVWLVEPPRLSPECEKITIEVSGTAIDSQTSASSENPGKRLRQSAAVARQLCKEEETTFCDLCKKQYLNKASYSKHMLIHTEGPHECDVCHKIFLRRDGLRSHYRTHTGEKPFECEFCNKKFAGKPNLTNHRRTHTGERPYECDLCEKSFAQKINLINHKRVHTGEKPFTCGICNKQFAQNGDLNNHKRTHTGDKPYSCSVCEKTFARNTDRAKHERTHTGDRPYACELCARRFIQRSHVLTHMRTMHGAVSSGVE